MVSSARGRTTAADWLARTFLAVVGVVVVVEFALLVSPPASGVAEPIRLVLAGLATLALPLGAAAVALRDSPQTLVVTVPMGFGVVALYALTGLLLPWTELSFSLGQVLVEGLLTLPVVGGTLARLLFGGFTLSQASLEAAFRVHYALVSLALVGLCVWLGLTAWERLVVVQTGSQEQ